MKIQKSRNNLKYSFSFKKKFNFPNKFDNFNITIDKIKNPLISSELRKSTNFYSKSNNKNNYNIKRNFIQFSYQREKDLLKSDDNINKYSLLYKNVNSPQISKGITGLSNRFFNHKRVNSNNKKINELKNNEDNKICILPEQMRVKNFSLKTSKILDFLNLNKGNNCFLVEKENMQKNIRLFKNYKFKDFRKIEKCGSFTNLNILKKLEDIYPNKLNIEGKKDRKLSSELRNRNKRKKKKEMLNSIFHRNNYNLKKKLTQEKNKKIDDINKSLSIESFKKQLALSTMKNFKKSLDHIKRKISYKFNIQLPLYNLFLNLD